MTLQSGGSALPYWLRLGLEKPVGIKGCGMPDCLPEDLDPVDVYCERHGNFLVGSPTRTRMIAMNVWRVVVCLVFWAAAETDNDSLLAAAAMILAGFVLALPLRHFPVAQTLTLVCWPVAAVAVVGFRGQREEVRLTVILICAGFAVLLTLAHMAGLTLVGGPRPPGDGSALSIAGVVAVSSAAVAVLSAGLIALHALSRVDVTAPFLLLGFVALMTGFVLMVHALIASANRIDRTVRLLIPVPGRPAPLRWTVSDRSAQWQRRPDAVDQIGRAFAASAVALIRFLRMLWHFAVRTLIRTVNLAHRTMVRAWRRSIAAVAEAIAVVGLAIRIGSASFVHSILVVFFPPALMLVAAYVIDVWAAWSVFYARTGQPLALVVQLADGLGALGALTLAWMILSGEMPRAVFVSAGRAASIAGANALVLLAIGGWVVGLASGYFGGAVSVGWATYGATAIVVVVTVWSRVRRRAQ